MKHSSARSSVIRKAVFQRLAWLFLAVVYLAAMDGCTRSFYRRQADNEVNDILCEKDRYPEWKIEQYHVYPDPRARFADPTDPDHPPMPPDDEAAWRLNPHPQQPGRNGVGHVEGTGYLEMIKAWDAQNRGDLEAMAKKDAQLQTLPDVGEGVTAEIGKRKGPVKAFFDEPLLAPQGGFVLNLDQAVELGVVNSRAYQTIREALYQTALPVTQQRFSFAYQWAASETAIREWSGPNTQLGYQNNWTLNSSGSFSKLFSTGALLTAGFANSVVFNFTGPHGVTTGSVINFNLLQPFLQGGGKAVNLEPLTQAERNLLYSIRSYAHFREAFYANIAYGSSLPVGLGVLAAGGGSPISALAALGIASTDVSGGFVGYLPALFRECDLAADQKLVKDLERALQIYEGYQEGGQFSPLQVDQVRSQLLNARNTVLSDKQFVDNALDQFKQVLGVPVNLPLVLDDSPVREITHQYDRYYEVLADADAAYQLVDKQEQLPAQQLRGFLRQTFARDHLVRGTEFQKKLPALWEGWVKLTDDGLKSRQEKLKDRRRKLLDAKTDLEMQGKTLPEQDLREIRETDFEYDLGSLEQDLRRYEARPWEKQAKQDVRRQEQAKLFRMTAYSAQAVLVWARNERFAAVGKLWPSLPLAPIDQIELLTADVNLAQEVAVQAALQNRWDLMNARAQVTDSWRQLRVTANALMGVLNAQYNLVSATPINGTNPFDFSAAGTTQQLSLNFQLPLNRLIQRNNYRTAIINYQQARRNLMNLEDTVAAQIRFDVRQLHLFAENYKIQQKLLQSFYSQVESALEVIVAPVDPDQLSKGTATSIAANAAALTNQYLQALNGLNNAQTKMYDIWLSYLATRIELYQDLERLPLDNRGVWIDELAHPTEVSRDIIRGAAPVNAADPAGSSQQPGEPFLRARLLAPAQNQGLE
jgi:hypothetical protein